MDTAPSKNSLTASMFYQKRKSRDSLTNEFARQKTKIDNAFNQNEKSMFESDSSNNTVSKSMKTPINEEARFTMN